MAALRLHTIAETIVSAVHKVGPGHELKTEACREYEVVAVRDSTTHHRALMLVVVEVAYAYLIYIIAANDGVDSEEEARKSTMRPEPVFRLDAPVFPLTVAK